MGTDIHGVVEYWMGRWEAFIEVPHVRNYGIFAKLADTHNEGGITPISPPRGLPSDVSDWTKFIFEADEHRIGSLESVTYLYAEEFPSNWLVEVRVSNRKHGVPVNYPTMIWAAFVRMLKNLSRMLHPPMKRNVRIIIWFDN